MKQQREYSWIELLCVIAGALMIAWGVHKAYTHDNMESLQQRADTTQHDTTH